MKVGDIVRYTLPRQKRIVEGVVVASDTLSDCMFDFNTGRICGGTKYKIKPTKGRAVWTTRFVDRQEGVQ